MKVVKYENSGILFIDKDNVVIKHGGENVIFYNAFLKEIFRINVDISTNHIVKSYDKKFIVFDRNRSIVYDQEGVMLNEDSNYYFSYDFDGSIFIDENEDKLIISKEKLLIFPYTYGEKIFSQNYYVQVYDDEKFLKSYSLKDGSEIWTRKFNEFIDSFYVEYQRGIIDYNSCLYFIIYSEGIIKCIVVDIKTGNLLNEYRGLYGEMILDGNFLYYLSPDNISVLNLETEELKTFSITNIFESSEIKRLHFPRWHVRNRIVYFTQSASVDMHSGNTGAIFGALDIQQLKILWYETIPKQHGIIGTIHVDNERIYLHTQDQTLFIYEVEK